MPNWSENDLYVRGPGETVHEFLGRAGGVCPLDFERFVAYPEHFRKLDEIAEEWWRRVRQNPEAKHGPRPKDGYNSGGYEWCIEHWGTKWSACQFEVEEAKTTGSGLKVVFHFSTAWSPPRPVIAKASTLFPSLVFELRYFEGGACFQGTYLGANGACMLDESARCDGPRGG